MIQKAASLWGIRPDEIEMSFDPIISLLISACAAEIEKLSGQIDTSQTRITEKLIQMMTPESVYGPRPAHTIIYAEPVERRSTLKPEHLFYFKKKVVKKNVISNYKNIFFSPIKDFLLTDMKVAYQAVGDSFKAIDDHRTSRELVQNNNGKSLSNSTIYIGIQSEEKRIDPSNLSFYFELESIEDRELFYHHLRNSKWSLNGQALNVIDGLRKPGNKAKSRLDVVFEDVSKKSGHIINQLMQFYDKHYQTVISGLGSTEMLEGEDDHQEEINAFIKDNGLKLEGNIHWIKIQFPRIIANPVLNEVFCSLNAMPVINRQLHEMTYRLKDFINIVPIKSEDLFLDIKEIANTDGKQYKGRDSHVMESEKGSFMVRNDSVGKLDQRKAREYLLYLIDLLKDESASFSIYNNDFLQSNMKDLNRLIALLEKKVTEINTVPVETTYVMLKPYKKKEKLVVDYWTTNGDLANGIKSGSDVELYSGSGVKQKSAYLLKTSFGGKNDLTVQERHHAYRRSNSTNVFPYKVEVKK